MYGMTWQDQVRGNPQAEYAAVVQARSNAAAGAVDNTLPWQARGDGRADTTSRSGSGKFRSSVVTTASKWDAGHLQMGHSAYR